MSKPIKYSILLIGLISLFYLDFIRDYVFKNIGFQVYYLNHITADGTSSIENYTDSFIENFIKDYSIQQLNRLKWIFTAIFISLFGVLGAFINTIFYHTKKVAIYFMILYGILFICSLIIYIIMESSNSFSFQMKLYLISMEIAHFLQSSLPTLFFLVSYKFYQQNKS